MSNLDHYLEFIQLDEAGVAALAKAVQLSKHGGTMAKGVAGMSPAYLALMTAPHLIKLGKFAFNKIFSKAEKACSGMPQADKNMCLRKFKLQAYTNQLRTLRSSMGKCKDTKDPNDCKDKLNVKVKAIQFKINMLKQAIRRGQ
jgi:hypothetical protein